jgi:murein DD-endopeptidase MepM/ murein hydrolase activator NlpD
MPSSARSTTGKRRRLCIGTAAVGLLAVLFVFGNPLTGRALATTIPMVFPLEKRVTVHDDYLAPRVGHLHQGSDLMAPKMTKELACVSGTVTLRVGTYGGVPDYSLWLSGDDGHGYFYIHINNDTPGTDDGAGGLANAFAPGLVSGAHVEQGQWIANVGDSGNAESTGPHLHFEIHETTSMSSPSMDPHDSLVNAPLYNEAPLPTGTTRYQQTDSHIAYAGSWYTFSTNAASGGSYLRAKTNGASATISFNGTYLGWVATKGTTLSKAQVSLDGGAPVTVDLAASSVAYQQRVWNTGTLAEGPHTVKISWDAKNAAGEYISVDAIEVVGTLTGGSAPPPGPTTTRYEQTDTRLAWAGAWATFSKTGPSAGSYGRANTNGASVTVKFTGTYLSWIATVGTTLGKARVSLDGGTAQSIDLARSTVAYQQSVWNTGVLSAGTHTVKISWDTGNAAGKYISIDAFDVIGTLDQPSSDPVVAPIRYEQSDGKIRYLGTWKEFITSGASGGSYAYADSSASASIRFNGTKLDLIATTGFTQGKARVSLDGVDKGTIDFSNPTTLRMQKVWTTGILAAGAHEVVVSWTDQAGALGGTRVNIDAVDVTGSLF